MRGGSTQRAQDVGPDRPPGTQAPENRRPGFDVADRRRTRKPKNPGVYLRRRILAVSVILFGVLALVLAAFAQTSSEDERALPIDPNSAGPGVVLAVVDGVGISSPVRPENLAGLGYHPEGESLVGMSPRGTNLSRNPLLDLFVGDSTPEEIQYYLMDPATRKGPRTGALDVGAEAGTAVYAPASGTVTAIRPDPVLKEDANVVEIKPFENPNLRVQVSLVAEINDDVGPSSLATAGITELGRVADSASVVRPQLAKHTSDAGNHVTVSASMD